MRKTLYISLAFLLVNCQKQIEFELPPVEQTFVVEAVVESGLPPRVIVTNTQGYFDPLDSNSFANIFVEDAQVELYDGDTTYQLTYSFINSNGVILPGYTSFDPNIIGQYGRNYTLNVQVGDKEAHATAKIPQPIILDSLWFLAYEAYDSLGFIWAKFTDPDTTGNCYRWFAQRINSYTYNYDPPYDNVIGTMKDARPLAPIGSSTDDKLFNGLTFDFAFPRGEDGILEGPDDEGIEEGFYKRGDTILVKSTTTTYPVYLYVRAFENQAVSNGSIFSSPGNLPYNIQGDGLGMFIGYGVSYDTLICE